jgi:hypothetical protein
MNDDTKRPESPEAPDTVENRQKQEEAATERAREVGAIDRTLELTEEEFDAQYTLVRNHIDRHAIWNYEDGVGCLFETYGPELEFVKQQDPRNIWTLVDNDGELSVMSGFHLTNRIGYFISTKPVPEGALIQVHIPKQSVSDVVHHTEVPDRYEDNYKKLTELLPPGQDHLRIKSDPYTPLVVERLSANQVSLCHYGEQNGDPMRDPEVVFVISDGHAKPVYFRNDFIGVEHATAQDLFGDVPVKPDLQRDLDSFVSTWWRNIREQGFFEEARKLNQTTDERPEEMPEATDPQTISGNQPGRKEMSENTTDTKRPLYDLKSGRVQVSIWDREGPNGDTRYTVNVSRSYKDKDGTWKRVSSFDPTDLPYLKEAFAKAEEILKQELGQDITSDVKVTRSTDAKETQKQSL